ncbi:MAG: TIGR00269 family protein [Candidatus Aenigmatarchaeota archaeon]|nr:MAG: TIGR00269 family protein [Candidatus Aenigmarchaeota archaeon]
MQKSKCSKCGAKAVIFRDYEGVALCRGHFLRSIEKRVKKVVRKHGMIEPGDRIGVALSGGKDSAVALHLMNMIVGNRPDVSIIAISINEGIRGSRDLALKKSVELCKKLDIEQHTFSYKEEFGKSLDEKVKEMGLGKDDVCGLCGVSRRWILNKKARELKVTKLCFGMNLDDEAESIMMNYVRGDIPRACRLGPVTKYSTKRKGGDMFIPRIKPLRWIPEKEVGLYARLAGLPFRPKECKYRGGLRVDVEKALLDLEKKHVGLMFTVVNTFDRMLPGIKKTLDSKETAIKKCKICGEPGSHEVCKACELWR